MNWITRQRVVVVFMIAGSFLATACGSSSSGNGNATSSPGVSFGVITAKTGTSVSVNGVAYSDSTASVSMDGTSGHSESELQEGMVVTVKGHMHSDDSTGDGAEIDYADNLEGPLTSVTSGTTSTLVALDQTILVDVNTHFTPSTTTVNSLATLLATTTPIIEVSGMSDSLGAVHATYIEVKDTAPIAASAIELKGTIASGSTNTLLKTFMINGLTVDYSAASLTDFPADGIADGQYVEVMSTFGGYNAATHTLAATQVENLTRTTPAEHDLVEVEGFVMNYNAGAHTFTVSGIAVNASGVTALPAIADGSIVEVKGTYAAGVLTATKVTLKTSL